MPGALTVIDNDKPTEKNLSWGEVDWMIEIAVAEMKLRQFHPIRIAPIGGGGMIPAAIMAYRMYKKDGIPVELLPPVYAKSYGHDNKQHQLVVNWPDDTAGYDSARTLFVDDIVDTGHTYHAIRSRAPYSQFYALVTKIRGLQWFSTFDANNYWWNFPWEKVPQVPRTKK